MMHIDITNTNLKKEEVIFVGISLSMSKTILALHLTALEITYYDRIFLRSLIAARVGYRFQNDAARKVIKNQKERNQVIQLTSGEIFEKGLQDYVNLFNELDGKREGLDFEIEDLLAELDTVQQF